MRLRYEWIRGISVIASIHLSAIYLLVHSKSVSNIHGGYFRLVHSNWLNSSELLSISLLTSRAASKATWSSITLGDLPLCNVIFTIVLTTVLFSHLLLHGYWKLPICPSTLGVPSLILHSWGHCLWRSFFSWCVTNFGKTSITIVSSETIINNLLTKHSPIFLSLGNEVLGIATEFILNNFLSHLSFTLLVSDVTN